MTQDKDMLRADRKALESAVEQAGGKIRGKGMTTRRARSIARRIAGDPSEVPRVAGVVDMRSRRPIPTFTLEAPGPDGWSKAPKGLLEALSC